MNHCVLCRADAVGLLEYRNTGIMYFIEQFSTSNQIISNRRHRVAVVTND